MNEVVIELRSEKKVKRFLRKPLTVVEYKDQGFLFGVEVWHNLWKMQEAKETESISTEDYVYLLYFLAADNYQKEHRKETNFTKEDVRKWVKYDMSQSDADKIAQVYVNSQIVGKKVSDIIFSDGKEDEKKK